MVNFVFIQLLQEEAYLQEAIKNSLQENAQKGKDAARNGEAPRISSAGQSLLLDFLEEAPPSAAQSLP